MSVLAWLAAALALVGAVLLVAALNALVERRIVRSVWRLTLAAALFALGAALAAIGLGIQGYRALTHEEVAATVRIEPLGDRRFRAEVALADGRTLQLLLAGDEFYVDARVLKWNAFANLLGLHTAYELERVAGRYLDVADERRRPRTVYALAPQRPLDLFALRRRYTLLTPLLDAEYGSGTFSAADEPVTYEVRVSTSGLLIRRAGER